MLTITHTYESGTLIEGTSRGDGSAEVLKANGWRWGRSISSWYIPHSRDRLPKSLEIRRSLAALENAGFEVETDISTEIRSAADVEADKVARQNARVLALSAKSDRKDAATEEAWDRHRRDVARLPPGGEPVKIGHHSERRHLRALDKADASMNAYFRATADSEEATRRAETATHTTGARYNPVTVANRISRIAASVRKIEREIVADAYDPETGFQPATDEQKEIRARRFSPRLEELKEQLVYWEGVRAEQIATGKATNYSSETIRPGDLVRIRGHWYKVVRANAKTVSVQTEHTWSNKSPWSEVQDHKIIKILADAESDIMRTIDSGRGA